MHGGRCPLCRAEIGEWVAKLARRQLTAKPVDLFS